MEKQKLYRFNKEKYYNWIKELFGYEIKPGKVTQFDLLSDMLENCTTINPHIIISRLGRPTTCNEAWLEEVVAEEKDLLKTKESLEILEKWFETFLNNLLAQHRIDFTKEEWHSIYVIRHNLYLAFTGIGETQYYSGIEKVLKDLEETR